MYELQYPIGEFDRSHRPTHDEKVDWIDNIKYLPTQLDLVLSGVTKELLDMPYRPEGWTIRQVVHHMADSHANAYVRFKLALTEDRPTIKIYEEAKWADLPDYKLPVEDSVEMLRGLHKKWTELLRHTTNRDFAREYVHPETGAWTLEMALGLYQWHGRHHLAQMVQLINKVKGAR